MMSTKDPTEVQKYRPTRFKVFNQDIHMTYDSAHAHTLYKLCRTFALVLRGDDMIAYSMCALIMNTPGVSIFTTSLMHLYENVTEVSDMNFLINIPSDLLQSVITL